MSSITLDEALFAADACEPPFSGDRANVPEIKSFLAANAGKISIKGSDGLTIDLKSVDIETAAPEVKTITLPARTAAASGTTLPADIEHKAAAIAEKMVAKYMAEEKARQRPGTPDPEGNRTKIGSVKSGEEVEYETKVAKRQAVFPNYAEAKAFAHSLAAKACLRTGDFEGHKRHVKGYVNICETKGYVTTDIAAGGALVAPQFDPRLIELIKEYGVARRVCTLIEMSSTNVTRSRATGDLTLYYPGEAGTVTQSTKTFSNVQLRLKEGIALVRMSTLITDTASVSMAEMTARDIARIIAKVEDDTLFNGTGAGAGTSYIPSVQGIVNMFGTTATTDSRSNTGGDTSDAHTRANLIVTMGKAPRYVGGMPAWHCSYEMEAILLGIALAQGGASVQDFAGLGTLNTVFGRPVIPNNVMNNNFNTSADTVDILFGDISQAAYMGVMGGVQIDVSSERFFDTNEIAVRGIVRHDITVHDLGSTSTQSPVVALYQT